MRLDSPSAQSAGFRQHPAFPKKGTIRGQEFVAETININDVEGLKESKLKMKVF
jgi:hypothetical protein